jgi:predicted lipoprotein with Yx(FWY)xxD motif
MKTRITLTLAAAALSIVALAGCSSTPAASGGSEPTSTPSASSGSADTVGTADLKTAKTSLGEVIVDGKGMTVYDFTKDVKDSGKSNCSGQCLALWPAVVASSGKPVVDGVTGTVGTITRDDGTLQVTVNGLPVYTYAPDKKAGDVTGQGVLASWYVVSPAGDLMKSASTSGY